MTPAARRPRPDERPPIDERVRCHFIDGAWRPQHEGFHLDVLDPSTGELLAEVPRGSRRDVDAALAAATEARRGWSALPPPERLDRLAPAVAALAAESEALARLQALDAGVTIAAARAQALRLPIEARAQLAAALAASTARGEARPGAPDEARPDEARNDERLLLRPRGIVAWLSGGGDAFEATAGILAALAAGNCVVWKPSSRAPVVAARLAAMIGERLPAGTFALLQGTGSATGARLCLDARVDALCASAGPGAAQALWHLATSLDKPCALRLAGRAVAIVDEEADPAAVAAALVAGLGRHAGQDGCAREVLVPRSRHEDLMAALATRLGEAKLGPAGDGSTCLGPLLDDSAARAFVAAYQAQVLRLAPRRISPTGAGNHVTPALALGGRPPVPGPALHLEGYADARDLDDKLAPAAGRAAPARALIFAAPGRALELAALSRAGLVGIAAPAAPGDGVPGGGGLDAGDDGAPDLRQPPIDARWYWRTTRVTRAAAPPSATPTSGGWS